MSCVTCCARRVVHVVVVVVIVVEHEPSPFRTALPARQSRSKSVVVWVASQAALPDRSRLDHNCEYICILRTDI